MLVAIGEGLVSGGVCFTCVVDVQAVWVVRVIVCVRVTADVIVELSLVYVVYETGQVVVVMVVSFVTTYVEGT